MSNVNKEKINLKDWLGFLQKFKLFPNFKMILHKQDNNNFNFEKETFYLSYNSIFECCNLLEEMKQSKIKLPFEIEFTDKLESKYDYRFNMKTKKLFLNLNQKKFSELYEQFQEEQKYLSSFEKW